MSSVARSPAVAFLICALAASAFAQGERARDLRPLIQKLAGKEVGQRGYAEHLLIREGDRAVPLLLPLLAHPDRGLRLRVVRMLGRIGEDATSAKKTLDDMLTTAVGDPALQWAVAISLLCIDPLHDPAIEILARSDDMFVKLGFSSALAYAGKKGLPHLMRMVRDREPAVRKRARCSLRTVVDSASLDKLQLRAILALGQDGPCKEAAVALAQLDKDAGPVLLRMLDSKKDIVRQAGFAGLTHMKKPPAGAVDRMRLLLRSGGKDTDRVLRYLGSLSQEPSWLIQELVRLLDADVTSTRTVVRKEIKSHSESAIHWARQQVGGTEWQQRRDAARVLAHVTVSSSEDVAMVLLVKLVQDPHADVRTAALRSLGWQAPHAGIAYQELRIALRDKEPRIRAAAAVALGAMGRKQQLPEERLPVKELAPLLADTNPAVRCSAIMALSSQPLPSGSPVIETWIKMLHDPERPVRSAAFSGLRGRLKAGELKRKQARSAFLAALVMPDAALRRAARSLLHGNHLLIEFLDHEDPRIRREAVWSLGEMGKDAREHLPKVRTLLADSDERVQAAAKYALGRIEERPRPKGPGTRPLRKVLR